MIVRKIVFWVKIENQFNCDLFSTIKKCRGRRTKRKQEDGKTFLLPSLWLYLIVYNLTQFHLLISISNIIFNTCQLAHRLKSGKLFLYLPQLIVASSCKIVHPSGHSYCSLLFFWCRNQIETKFYPRRVKRILIRLVE